MLEYSPSFLTHLDDLRSRLTTGQMQDVRHLETLLPDWRRPASYNDLGAPFMSESENLHQKYGDEIFSVMNKVMNGELALKLPEALQSRNLPPDVLKVYPDALKRFESYILRAVKKYFYPSEYFIKDLRFVAGMTVPCGAGGGALADLRSVVGWKPSPLHFVKNHPRDVVALVKNYKKQPWIRTHLDPRYLSEFNAENTDLYYKSLASIMKLHTDVLGMVGTTWFIDPVLETVSPHLSHQSSKPLAQGAYIIRGSTTDQIIRAATLRSPERKELYNKGLYKPTNCLIIWPRDAMLRWHG